MNLYFLLTEYILLLFIGFTNFYYHLLSSVYYGKSNFFYFTKLMELCTHWNDKMKYTHVYNNFFT